MRKAINRMSWLVFFIISTAACDTLKNLPTNTTGGVFSLNGTWRLAANSDSKSLEGTTITVYPVIGNGTVKSLSNNTYCIKEGDLMWRNIKSGGDGGFRLSTLVGACNGTTIIKEGVVTVVNTNEITLTTRTAGGSEMTQQWKRVTGE